MHAYQPRRRRTVFAPAQLIINKKRSISKRGRFPRSRPFVTLTAASIHLKYTYIQECNSLHMVDHSKLIKYIQKMKLLFDRRHSQNKIKNKANADTVYVLCPPPPLVALFAAAVSVFGVLRPSPDQIKGVCICIRNIDTREEFFLVKNISAA